MENDLLASALREIPFRICANERGYSQNKFVTAIKAVSFDLISHFLAFNYLLQSPIGKLLMSAKCEENFKIIANAVNERLKNTIQSELIINDILVKLFIR